MSFYKLSYFNSISIRIWITESFTKNNWRNSNFLLTLWPWMKIKDIKTVLHSRVMWFSVIIRSSNEFSQYASKCIPTHFKYFYKIIKRSLFWITTECNKNGEGFNKPAFHNSRLIFVQVQWQIARKWMQDASLSYRTVTFSEGHGHWN